MNCPSLPTGPTDNRSSDFFNRMMESLTNGHDSAITLWSRLNGGGESSNNYEEEELTDNILASFSHGFSLLQDEFDKLDRSKDMIINNGGDINSGLIKSEENFDGSPKNVAMDGRGRHKRRKTGESWEKITETLLDDGHAWRKYGQKNIIGTNHQRSYYKCTHVLDQGCQAKKHIQKVSDEPERYKTIYIGHHTCTNSPLQTTQPSILIDCSVHEDGKDMMCFETKCGPAAAGPNYYNGERPPQKTPTTKSTPSAALSFSSADFCIRTGTATTSSSNASTLMKEQGYCSHHPNIIHAEDHIMMMNMSNHNLMNADMEQMFSSSPSDNCNFSYIDHPTAIMNNSPGPDHSAAGSDNGGVVTLGNCPPGPPSCLDSLECFDIDSYMIDNFDDVLGFTFR